jgi:type IV pilus biogenesis protein CpaD/CtpE
MRSRLAAVLAFAALAGCAHDGALPYMGGPDNFGEANRVTLAAQVVDPDPEYDTAVPETQADHAGKAVERYRTDKVKKPDRVRTSNSATGGGGSGGSGSGGGGN